MATLLELRGWVRNHLAESSTQLFDDTLVTGAINRAQRGFALNVALFRRIWRTTTVVGQEYLSPAADWGGYGYGRPRLNTGVGSDRELERLDPAQIWQAFDSSAYGPSAPLSIPNYWTWDEEGQLGTPGRIYLHPRPNLVYSIAFNYLALPTALAATTDIPWFGLFADYHDLISLGAAHDLMGHQGAKAAGIPTFAQRRDARLGELQTYLSKNRNEGGMRLTSSLSRPPWRRI